MKVRFNDLQSQYLQCKEGIDNAIQNVLNNGNYILGDEVRIFQENFAKYIGTSYAVGVDNGTTSIELALKTLGVCEGDEVITVSNTFIATALGISACGAKIVLVDCDYFTQLIDTSKIVAAITERTKVIMPVHLFGQMADMKAIMKIAAKYNIKVIEDCSQAQGATQDGVKAGMLGDISCFSLYPAKNLGAIGDAGVITTNNKEYYDHLIRLSNYGSLRKYYHDFIGKNARLDTINAAVLNVKLKYLDKWNAKRNQIADLYDAMLEGVKGINLPQTAKDNYNIWHLYVITVLEDKRNGLQQHLKEKGIETGIHYPVPIHQQKAYEGYFEQSFRITEQLSKQILSLPMHPYLTIEEVAYVANEVKEYLNNS